MAVFWWELLGNTERLVLPPWHSHPHSLRHQAVNEPQDHSAGRRLWFWVVFHASRAHVQGDCRQPAVPSCRHQAGPIGCTLCHRVQAHRVQQWLRWLGGGSEAVPSDESKSWNERLDWMSGSSFGVRPLSHSHQTLSPHAVWRFLLRTSGPHPDPGTSFLLQVQVRLLLGVTISGKWNQPGDWAQTGNHLYYFAFCYFCPLLSKVEGLWLPAPRIQLYARLPHGEYFSLFLLQWDFSLFTSQFQCPWSQRPLCQDCLATPAKSYTMEDSSCGKGKRTIVANRTLRRRCWRKLGVLVGWGVTWFQIAPQWSWCLYCRNGLILLESKMVSHPLTSTVCVINYMGPSVQTPSPSTWDSEQASFTSLTHLFGHQRKKQG